MSKRRVWLVALLFAAPPAATAQEARADRPLQQQTPPPTAVDEVVVVTASRRQETFINAPATMTVMSGDLLEQAQGQSVPDLLRLVPGLNVAQTSARDFNVTARGATGTLAHSLLVLLDGRSIYQDFFGCVMWDFLPVATSDIKQIEVIRGPASAVWGANAMTGVINVITKTPREMPGTTLAVRFGQFDRSPTRSYAAGSLMAVDAAEARALNDRWAYKISGEFLAQEPFLRPAGTVNASHTAYPPFENRGTRQPKLDARVDYDAPNGQKVVAAAGISGSEGLIHTGIGPLDIQRGAAFTYGRLTYQRDKLNLQLFANVFGGKSPAPLAVGLDGRPLEFDFDDKTYDVEFSNLHVLGTRQVLSYGGNYRHNDFNLSLAPRGRHRDEGGAYAQDQIFLTDHLRWIAGARVDRFGSLNKIVVSPRTTFMVKARATDAFRVSFNRAFRSPSMVNNFLEATFLNQVDLPGTGPFVFPTTAAGNDALKEETLTAYEAGYTRVVRGVTVGAAIYLNRTDNSILFTPGAVYASSAPPPRWPLAPALLDVLNAAGQGLPSRLTYLNFRSIVDKGVELSVDARILSTSTGFANYSWQAAPASENPVLNLAPAHRLNVGAHFNGDRSYGSLSLGFVGRAYWTDVLDARFYGFTPAYTNVNASFGVRSADNRMAVTVAARNCLNRTTQQHVFGDLIGRTLTGEVRFRL